MNSSIKKNIAYNFTYQILILILPFITAPYLSRIIGAEGVGIYSFSQSIALYCTYIAMLGLNNYGNRSIAAVQENEKERSKVFFEIYFMQLIMFTISIAIYVAYVIFFSVDKVAAKLMIIWVISSMFDINWFFFGMEQFKITVIRNTCIKILTVICIFIFVRDSTDVYRYIVIMAMGTLLSQCCLWPYMKKFVHYEKPTLSGILSHFKPNLKLFIPVIAASIYTMMGKIMLGYMTDMQEVGFYENADKIIKMIQSLIVAVGTVMLPRMTALFAKSKDQEGGKYLDIAMEAVLIYVSVAIFGVISVADIFTELYFGPGFEKTSILLIYLIPTVLFFGIGNVLRTQYLIPKKLDKIYINSALIGAVLNLITNWILIPMFNSVGAAISTLFAEISVCVYQFYMVRQDVKIRKYILGASSYLLSGLIMYVILKLVPTSENIALCLLQKICLGGIVYIVIAGAILLIRRKEI